MVSKASEDLPEPERPVITTSRSRGISTSTFLRLCSRAPRTTMLPAKRLPASQLRAHDRDGALDGVPVLRERLRAVRLEAQHEDGLGVRRPHEAPAVREADAHPVDVDDLVAEVTEPLAYDLGDAELDRVGAVDPDLGGRVRRRQVGEELVDRAPAAREDLEQP